MITRPHKEAKELNSIVGGVLDDIRQRGDAAVKEYEQKFDKVSLTNLKVTDEAVAPTCTEAGLTEGEHCGRCGTVFRWRRSTASIPPWPFRRRKR